MSDLILIRKNSYFDSVLLMRLSRELKSLGGIDDAVVAMGTPQNRALLSDAGYNNSELESASPNDLVIAVRGESLECARIEQAIAELLKADRKAADSEDRPRSLAAALHIAPGASLALISVPGQYAAREARAALSRGLHVMLFSDNVSIDDEAALKREAIARGLLMMGPDCGTAIINGKPLAFANVVRRGAIGIVGASGTGIQEATCRIHHLGGGISQAIGTGGRDLSDQMGGLMTLAGIDALADDPATRIIVVISKPPSLSVAAKVIEALQRAGKQAVIHFVGDKPRRTREQSGTPHVTFADSLADAGTKACQLLGLPPCAPAGQEISPELISTLVARLSPGAQLRGLFCGGTTGQEAVAILDREGIEVFSNLHKSGPLHIDGTDPVSGNVVLDLGADEFTVGRPHPMIDPLIRNERLADEAANPNAGLLLFDCMLGYGSHPDPAGVLADGVLASRGTAARRGGSIVAIASITGTPEDPQDFHKQKRKIEDAGVFVVTSNCQAARLAAEVLRAAANRQSARQRNQQ
ncbi:MAG: acyl-CoA synthetase FdrA [bacterium]|nr:acyl-CoA synthetase FdrA [Candidatus Sumerlaeota bacterium]